MTGRAEIRSRSLLAAVTCAALVLVGAVTDAHKPITSKYTYHRDVYPIFVAQCGGCHATDAVAPMSLLTYEDAYPWAQSIKEEVVNLTMPPWQAEEGFGAFKHGGSLSARQLDIVVEWANGGTPEGEPLDRAAAAEPSAWPLGEPATVLDMPEMYTLEADVLEAIRYFVVPSGFADDVLVRATDFRPGAAAVVRSAIVYVDTSGEARDLDAADPEPGFAAAEAPAFPTDRVLAAWLPGQEPVTLDSAGYVLPGNADLVLRLAYKKTWTYEGLAVEDRSSLAVYLAAPTAPPVETIALQPAGDTAAAAPLVSFSTALERDVDLLAILPDLAVDALAVQIEAVAEDGRRHPIIRLASPRPEWRTRYWLTEPMRLARGTVLEVTALLSSTAPAGDMPVRFTLDLVGAEADVAPN